MTDVEKKIVDILKEITGYKAISKESNFFELGGDSLRAIKFTNVIKEKFNLEYSIGDLFEHPCIKDIAVTIEGRSSSNTIEEEGII